MQSSDFRAKQFLPFDSLNGFRTLLKDAENGILESNIFFDNIKYGDRVKIRYFFDDSIFECIGIVRRIDLKRRKLYLIDSIIDLDNILDIVKE